MTLHITTAADLLALKIPARQYLLHPWLPEGGLAFIYARAGVGKTHLGLAVAKGGRLWSRPTRVEGRRASSGSVCRWRDA